jgi:hypothetical protein
MNGFDGEHRMQDAARADISRLEARLLGIAARQRRAGRLWVAVLSAAAVLAGAFVYFVADRLTDFPAPVRILLTLALPLAVWRWGARRWARRVFSDVSVSGAARLMERLQVEFNSTLISTVQFAPDLQAPGGSPLLRMRTIETTSEGFDRRAEVPIRPPEGWRRAGVMLLVPFLLFLPFALLAPRTLAIFAMRAIGLDVAYPTRTRIAQLDFPKRIANDQDAVIEIRTEGVDPESGRLRLTFDGQEPAELALRREGPHRFTFTAAQPPVGFAFEALLGDAPPKGGRVQVVAPPGAKSLRVRIEPPAYAGQAPTDVDGGSAAAPEGSRLTIDLEPNRELAECRLRLPDGPVPLTADKGRYRHAFTPATSFLYSFEMKDRDGVRNSKPAEYSVEIRVDRPPDLVVSKPEMERVVSTVSLVPLQLTADDDLGLREVVVEYWTEPIPTGEDQAALASGQGRDDAGRPRQRAVLASGLTVRHLELNETVPVARFAAPVGTLVHYRLGVKDSCPAREQVTWADERILRVVSARELAALLSERHAALLKTVNRIVEDETAAHKRLRRFLEDEK